MAAFVKELSEFRNFLLSPVLFTWLQKLHNGNSVALFLFHFCECTHFSCQLYRDLVCAIHCWVNQFRIPVMFGQFWIQTTSRLVREGGTDPIVIIIRDEKMETERIWRNKFKHWALCSGEKNWIVHHRLLGICRRKGVSLLPLVLSSLPARRPK